MRRALLLRWIVLFLHLANLVDVTFYFLQVVNPLLFAVVAAAFIWYPFDPLPPFEYGITFVHKAAFLRILSQPAYDSLQGFRRRGRFWAFC